jgi:hypothetical protein
MAPPDTGGSALLPSATAALGAACPLLDASGLVVQAEVLREHRMADHGAHVAADVHACLTVLPVDLAILGLLHHVVQGAVAIVSMRAALATDQTPGHPRRPAIEQTADVDVTQAVAAHEQMDVLPATVLGQFPVFVVRMLATA